MWFIHLMSVPSRLIRGAFDVDFGVKFFKKRNLNAKLLAFSPRVIVVHAQLKEVGV